MATVRIPTPLRKYTQGQEEVTIEAGNVREALDALETAHPGIKAKLCDDSGNVRRFINIYADDEDIDVSADDLDDDAELPEQTVEFYGSARFVAGSNGNGLQDPGEPGIDGDEGCACSTSSDPAGGLGALGMLGLFALLGAPRRRRR